jgi:hypothetical protein
VTRAQDVEDDIIPGFPNSPQGEDDQKEMIVRSCLQEAECKYSVPYIQLNNITD